MDITGFYLGERMTAHSGASQCQMDYILKFGTNFWLTCEKTYKLGETNGTNVVSELSQKLQFLIAKSRPNIGFGDTKRKSLK